MPTINTDRVDLFRAIGDYVVSATDTTREQIVITPAGNEPLPFGAVVVNILDTRNLDTHATNYDVENSMANVSRSVQVRIQLDFYGVKSGERSQIIESLWRTEYSVDTLSVMTPLYVNSRMRDMYINDSERYEDRWLLDLTAQYNPVVSHNQEFVTETQLTIQRPTINEVL